MNTRIEEDLLGTREVPSTAYYGIHTVRAIENFQISGTQVSDVPEFVRGMVMVKKASALANKEVRVLQHDIADAIVRACDAILDEGRCMDQFPVDVFQGGAGTSTNMNTNEVVANLALELAGFDKGRYDLIHPNDHVNKSQSTNDAYPTGFRLAVYFMVQKLIRAIDNLAAAFKDKGAEFASVLKMGRTQLQDAVPMSLGQEFTGFATNILEEVRRLEINGELLLEINLGATAIGTGLNTPPGYPAIAAWKLSKVCGLTTVPAHDLVPRAGLNEINLPELQAGSSIMPAKVNPVIPEVVNQVCFKVMGNDVTTTLAAEAGQLQLNVMEPGLAQSMFESINLLTHACDTLRTKCVTGITANVEVCRNNVFNSIGIITYFNEIIGHQAGDLVGKECARTGKSVREVLIEKGLMTPGEIDKILTTDNFLNPSYSGAYYGRDDKGLPDLSE